jgi:hypothetical protein
MYGDAGVADCSVECEKGVEMVYKLSRRQRKRNAHGASIAEFGPALGLLLICFFFPLLDLIGISVSYGCCALLNNTQVHEASLLPWQEATDSSGVIRHDIPDTWLNSGIGRFAKVSAPIKTKVNYRTGQTGDKIVEVKTRVICDPFLSIPVPVANVPGLNGPMIFVIASERTMENPDYGK